jgi:hypothetical protein
MAKGYFVKNVCVEECDNEAGMVKNIQIFIKEFSETLNAISDSYNNGNNISEKEVKIIRKEWEDLKRMGEGFVGACESGVFNK